MLTTAPSRYRVKPASGTLDAGASIDVHLVLTPQDTLPDDLSAEWGKDKFQIKSLALSRAGGSDASADAVSEAWKTAPADVVEATRLRCSHAHGHKDEPEASTVAEPAPASSPAAAPVASPAVKRTTTPTAAPEAATPAQTPRARDAGDEAVRWLASTPPFQLAGSMLVKLPKGTRERMLLPTAVLTALLLVWYADRVAARMTSGSPLGFLALLGLAGCYARWLVGMPLMKGTRSAAQTGGGSTPRRSKKAT